MTFHRLRLILNREVRRGVAPSKTSLPPPLRRERGIPGVRLIHNNQRGFTLIELIIAIAIAGIITGGITMTIFQVFSGNIRTSNHMTAVKQVQNAGYWISHDAQMAQNVGTGGADILTLTWVGWEWLDKHDNQFIDSYEVIYTYDTDSDRLWRHQTITRKEYDKNGEPVEPPAPPAPPPSTTLIAEYITSISIPPMDNDKLTIEITASVGDAVEERTYEITPRPST